VTLHEATVITDCPHGAWFVCRKGCYTRMPHAIAARARTFAALRCNWRRSEEGAMSLGVIGEMAHIHKSSVSHALKVLCGSTEPAACRAWLDEWAKGGVAH
jgi:hypothetical protein